jgi:hypothetical protein
LTNFTNSKYTRDIAAKEAQASACDNSCSFVALQIGFKENDRQLDVEMQAQENKLNSIVGELQEVYNLRTFKTLLVNMLSKETLSYKILHTNLPA